MLVSLTKNIFLALGLGVLVLTAACNANPGLPTPTPLLMDPGPEECQDAVRVVVWGDLNRDGIKDPDEPPLAEVLLQIAKPGDPPADGLQMSTSAAGDVYFPTRELDDCRPASYQVLFLRQVPGYEFPEDPVADLEGFKPDLDAVMFGLIPLE